LNDFWKVDPEPLRLACKLERSAPLLVAPGVVEALDPFDLLLLPHALATSANETVKTRSSWVLLTEVKDGPLRSGDVLVGATLERTRRAKT
jgi:hypothetical protein